MGLPAPEAPTKKEDPGRGTASGRGPKVGGLGVLAAQSRGICGGSKLLAGARQRIYDWREAEGSERRQGEATVLRGTLDGICGDGP